ncbi:uncharacterized protein LOC117176309 [Belonocnema kinseyi]|uniref:uncharacterized protein LOC117176309 n=1 Tax=Belonocnema kinseyi TaxID=2817044 RepID=UPI00143DBC3A|nr:uncharacterized protein LOC117176309 [Belonocnema kinseyi]
MQCRIMPVGKNSEISYRVKCVSVENERVFGDFFVTQQTQNSEYCADYFSPASKAKKFNLTRKTLESPDFMKMNSKPVSRRRSTISHRSEQIPKNYQRSKSVGDDVLGGIEIEDLKIEEVKKQKIYPEPLKNIETKKPEEAVSTLVDKLLSDIYGIPFSDRGRSDSDSSTSSRANARPYNLQKTRLSLKSVEELYVVLKTLKEHVSHAGGLLIRQLRRRDYLIAKRDKQCDVITAHLQAHSKKTSEDTRMRFSLAPQAGESGFTQWLDAMKMVAKLPGGIPAEFRSTLWITLAERHLDQRRVDWKQAEKVCFNEWSNPDDEELGTQIVKDLHRTGCSLFCGAAGRDNQAVLRRVLLGFARWNKSVGYCQGLNVLAALILQVVDRAESSAVKVMIHLIEGVLPEGYFADNLRGLSVDMAVFRDLLRMRLPRLSKHLETLQSQTKDKATGSSYEPPLTNVFTMQWFLTLFCHCLPQEAVLRVWDLIFLEGDEVLLRTALAIWEGISERIMTVKSADEFYSIMGVLTREMLEFTDTNNLIKNIVSMGPLYGVTSLREKHRYNITPWTRRLSEDEEDSETEEDERLAVAAAAAIFSMPHRKKDRTSSALGALQTLGSDRDRLALDITTLKQQYAKLRERQRQAHIILSAACARQTMVPPPTSAMNHLLVGKSALVSGRSRQIAPSPITATSKVKSLSRLSPRSQSRKERQAVTLHWKDMKKRKDGKEISDDEGGQVSTLVHSPETISVTMTSQRRSSADSDSDSTSTELCDEPDRLSDLDSEEATSTSDFYAMVTDDEKSPRIGSSPIAGQTPARIQPEVRNEFASVRVIDIPLDSLEKTDEQLDVEETSIAEITDQIRRLSAGDNDVLMSKVLCDRESEKIFPEDSKSVSLEEFKGSFESLGTCPFLGNSCRVGETDLDSNVNESEVDLEEKYQYREIRVDENAVSINNDRTIADFNYDYKSFDISFRPDIINSDESTLNHQISGRSYIEGHLPISPSVTGQESGKISFDTESRSQPKESNGWFHNLDYSYQKTVVEKKNSPKTPESISSGETMGPDSKPSSLTVSPRTPLRSEARDLTLDKSSCSSVSSNSKTLTLQSVDNDMIYARANLEPKIPSTDKSCPSTPISVDSLKAKSDFSSPKLVVSSSSESCSPSKFKSSEISFSSDLQSPISANSIKFTSNYKDNSDLSETSPIELTSITSPFYPIAHPNQKTPSPYDALSKQKADSTGVSPNHRYSTPRDLFKSDYSFSESKSKPIEIFSSEYQTYESDSSYKYNIDPDLGPKISGSAFHSYQKGGTLSALPRENELNRLSAENNSCGRTDYTRPFERSCSSLDKKFLDLVSPGSNEELASSVKKRSSDILEDLKHLESKSDGTSDTNMLTKKTGYIWEDVQDLEARRQDTFSDSASGFSKRQIDIPGISISNENRKTYIVEPKINIDESSDSILKKVSQNSHRKDSDDDRDSKLGVWTKVKPRKIGDSGRRSSSDRALKIIQENSAILQKILTCQAKKRLPDLEEISKEITISPINEEISKIFSPILEKMGLSEHEINEELARINNYKDMDHMTSSTSEFNAKMNDELCKFSLIGDDEYVDPNDFDEIISQDYLKTRDACIDRQINEELSKLLLNYEGDSPAPVSRFKQDLDQNIDIYKYKPTNQPLKPNGSISIPEKVLHSEKYSPYEDPILPSLTPSYQSTTYSTTKYIHSKFTPKSDIDIYRELEKLDQISSVNVLSTASNEIPEANKASVPYIPHIPETSPYSEVRISNLDYSIQAEKPFNTSPQKSPYDTYKPYDFKSSISPRKTPNSPYSARSYEKSYADSSFDLSNQKTFDFDFGHKKVLSKETLEFRVRYDDEPKPIREVDLTLSPFPTDLANLDKGLSYYTDKSLTPTSSIQPMKYTKNDEKFLTSTALSPLEYKYDRSDHYVHRKYESISPKNYENSQTDFDRQPYKLTNMVPGTESYSYFMTEQMRESHLSSTTNQFADHKFAQSTNPFLAQLAPGLEEASKRPVSHPEFPDKLNMTKYCDLSSIESANHRKSSLSLGNIGHVNRPAGVGFDGGLSPKSNFSPFPVRNAPRKPRELGLKLGLYSPTSPGKSEGKKS